MPRNATCARPVPGNVYVAHARGAGWCKPRDLGGGRGGSAAACLCALHRAGDEAEQVGVVRRLAATPVGRRHEHRQLEHVCAVAVDQGGRGRGGGHLLPHPLDEGVEGGVAERKMKGGGVEATQQRQRRPTPHVEPHQIARHAGTAQRKQQLQKNAVRLLRLVDVEQRARRSCGDAGDAVGGPAVRAPLVDHPHLARRPEHRPHLQLRPVRVRLQRSGDAAHDAQLVVRGERLGRGDVRSVEVQRDGQGLVRSVHLLRRRRVAPRRHLLCDEVEARRVARVLWRLAPGQEEGEEGGHWERQRKLGQIVQAGHRAERQASRPRSSAEWRVERVGRDRLRIGTKPVSWPRSMKKWPGEAGRHSATGSDRASGASGGAPEIRPALPEREGELEASWRRGRSREAERVGATAGRGTGEASERGAGEPGGRRRGPAGERERARTSAPLASRGEGRGS